MSQLFSCMCNEPRRLIEALEPVRHTLVARGPVAGWGLGYAHGGEVLLRRHPRPAVDVDLYDQLREIHSDYIVCQASADPSYSGTDNTQPFRYRNWLYAQTGTIDAFDAVRAELLDHVPEFMRRSIRGKTPAEHIFHVFLAFLHDAGGLDDPNLALARSRRALRDTAALVLSLVTKHGASGGTGSIIVTNARSMLAARLGPSVHVRRFNGTGTHEGKDFRALLVLCDTEDPGEGFEEIPDRSVLMISRDLQTDIAPLEA